MNREAFIDEIRRNGDDADALVVERVFAWADDHDMRDTWRHQLVPGNVFTPVMRGFLEWSPTPLAIGMSDRPFAMVSGGDLLKHHPFSIESRWQEVLARLHRIPHVKQRDTYPGIDLSYLSDEQTWTEFFAVINSIVLGVRRSAERGLL